jgi:hypothetical protein
MDAQSLQATLEKFREEGAHLLLPSTFIPETPKYHTVAVDQVVLSPDTKEGDVYPQQQKKLALTRQGLMKLANAAGIIWDPNRSRRLDDRTDKDYVVYQAVGGYKKLDGTPLFMKAEYDLDFEVIRDEIEEGYEIKRQKWKADASWFKKMTADQQDAYIKKCIRRDVLQKRKHKIKLAETGAMTRVIRGLLNLKATYTVPELKKPFIVVRLVFQPDYDDPEVKSRMAAAAVGAVAGVFGPGATQPALPPASQESPVTEAEIPEAPPMDDDEPPETIPNGSDCEPGCQPDALGAFLDMSTTDRLSLFGTMAKKRGIANEADLWTFWTKISGKPKPSKISAMPEDDMVQMFEALQDDEKRSDIPF